MARIPREYTTLLDSHDSLKQNKKGLEAVASNPLENHTFARCSHQPTRMASSPARRKASVRQQQSQRHIAVIISNLSADRRMELELLAQQEFALKRNITGYVPFRAAPRGAG
jgi:hypothetical protein